MLTHLISTTEFVKLVKDNSTSLTEISIANQYIQCLRYANFVSRKPELWMFVPCDEDGNVLEEPKLPYAKPTWCDKCEELNPEYSKWYKAQSKVLFKSWKWEGTLIYKNGNYLDLSTNDFKTLEILLYLLEGYSLFELTETALKQIL